MSWKDKIVKWLGWIAAIALALIEFLEKVILG